jgi:hypothetical protein
MNERTIKIITGLLLAGISIPIILLIIFLVRAKQVTEKENEE